MINLDKGTILTMEQLKDFLLTTNPLGYLKCCALTGLRVNCYYNDFEHFSKCQTMLKETGISVQFYYNKEGFLLATFFLK